MKKIPVTIISGFLGAGKTSLLNSLITKHRDKKFAIIENEFGKTGIDGALIKSAPDTIFELNNGCICCTLGEDFLHTLETLLGSTHEFDYLLVETTGIADPSSIIDAFISGSKIQERFRIDSVVCVADALYFDTLFENQPEFRKQLALADLILLNKTDCITSDLVDYLNNQIRNFNPTSKIHSTIFCDVSNIEVLNIFSYSGKSISNSTIEFCGLDLKGNSPENRMSYIHKSIPGKQDLKHDIISVGFTFKGNFDVNKFGLWMQNYLYFNENNIFRVKGIMSFHDTEDSFVFHAVRSNFMFEVSEPWGEKERISRIVFIGKNIDEKILETSILQLLV